MLRSGYRGTLERMRPLHAARRVHMINMVAFEDIPKLEESDTTVNPTIDFVIEPDVESLDYLTTKELIK